MLGYEATSENVLSVCFLLFLPLREYMCDVSMYISYAFPSVRNKCATDNDGWLNDG